MILSKGFKAPLPLEAAFQTRQAKDFNPRFKRTRDQKQMLLEDTSACPAVWGHGYGGEDNSSRNHASPRSIINRCIMGGKEREGVSPLIHSSPSPNHRHAGLRRAGAGSLKQRHHVREMETFHVVNPQGCQRNPNERGSCWGWQGAPRTGLEGGADSNSGRQEPGPLPSRLTLSA